MLCQNKTGYTRGTQESIQQALVAHRGNRGKDEYVIDVEGHEKQYCLGTESCLLQYYYYRKPGVYSLNSMEPARQEMDRVIDQ